MSVHYNVILSGNTTNGIIIQSSSIQLDAPNTYIPQGDTLNFGTNGSIISTSGKLTISSLAETRLIGPLLSVNTSNVSFSDPILTIANYTQTLSDPTDRGIEFPYTDSSGGTKLGWFGYKRTLDAFTFIPNATNNAEVISGSSGNVFYSGLVVNNISITGGSFNAGCGDILNVNTLTGCHGTINIMGTDNVNISADNILLLPGNNVLLPLNKPLLFGSNGSYITGSTNGLSIDSNKTFLNSASTIIPISSTLSFGTSASSSLSSNTNGVLNVISTNSINISSGNVYIPPNTGINLGSTSNVISGNTNGILVVSSKIIENVSGEINLNSLVTRTNTLAFGQSNNTTNSILASAGNMTLFGSGTNNIVFKNFTSLFVPDYTSITFDTSASLVNSTSGINLTTVSGLNITNSSGNVNVSTGNSFNIEGTTTNINSVNTTFRDPILTLSNVTTTTNDLKDRGIEYNYVQSGTTTASLGWFGYKNSTDRLTFYSKAVNNGEIISGTLGTIEVGNIIISNNFAINNIDLNCGTIANLNTIIGCSGILNVVAPNGVYITSGNTYVSGEVNANSFILSQTSGMSITGNTSGVVTLNAPRTIINGDLQVNGTTSNVYSTVTNIQDPIISIGGVTGPLLNDSKDRGIEFKYYTTATKTGFFGYKNSLDRFVVIKDGANTNEVFSGAFSDIQVGNLYTGTNIYGPTSISNTIGNLDLSPSGYTNIIGKLYFDGTNNIYNTNGNLQINSSTTILNSSIIQFGSNVTISNSSGSLVVDNSGGGFTFNQSSGNFVINNSSGSTLINSNSLIVPTGSYIGFGDTKNSAFSDGSELYLYGYQGVNISPDLTVSGDVYIGGTLHVANFQSDSDLNKYILPLGTEQRLIISDVSNSSTSGVLSITTTSTHFFVPGDSVTIRNTTSDPVIDGAYTVNTIIDSDTFTIAHSDLIASGSIGVVASVLTYDHAKDVGIQVNFWSTKNATSATSGSINYETGFFGFKKSLERMVYYHDATISNNVVVAGNLGDIQVSKVLTSNISGFILDGAITAGSNNISGTSFTIGGGSVNNTPVGATTAATGRFTTLTNTISATLTAARMSTTLAYTPDRFTVSSGTPTGSPSSSTTVTFISVSGATFTGSGTMPTTGLSDGQLKVLVCSTMGTNCVYNLAFPSGTLVTPRPCTGPATSRLEFKRAGQSIQIIWDAVGGFWTPVSSGVYVR
jgi:hypothetical protein